MSRTWKGDAWSEMGRLDREDQQRARDQFMAPGEVTAEEIQQVLEPLEDEGEGRR